MKESNIIIGEFKESEDSEFFKSNVLISKKYLEQMQEAAMYQITDKLSDAIVEEFKDRIEFELDFGEITQKVQQSIINTLTIKQLRENLKYEGKIS